MFAIRQLRARHSNHMNELRVSLMKERASHSLLLVVIVPVFNRNLRLASFYEMLLADRLNRKHLISSSELIKLCPIDRVFYGEDVFCCDG